MANDKRIPELPPLNVVPGTALLAIYDVATDTTYRATKASIAPDQSESSSFSYIPESIYAEDDVVVFNDELWISQADANQGNTPFDGSSFWSLATRSFSGLVFWNAGVFLETTVITLFRLGTVAYMFELANATRPFNSTNFLTELAAGDWRMISGIPEIEVSTSGGTITLDMVHAKEMSYHGSASFGTAKNIVIDNDENAVAIRSFKFVMTTAVGLTFESNVKMADALWNTGTKTWTPFLTGDYEMTATFDGTDWRVKITGPYT